MCKYKAEYEICSGNRNLLFLLKIDSKPSRFGIKVSIEDMIISLIVVVIVFFFSIIHVHTDYQRIEDDTKKGMISKVIYRLTTKEPRWRSGLSSLNMYHKPRAGAHYLIIY